MPKMYSRYKENLSRKSDFIIQLFTYLKVKLTLNKQLCNILKSTLDHPKPLTSYLNQQ